MPPRNSLMAENTLYFGDNLKILRDNIRDETVDLIYLDPPFNSKANYNVLFRSPKGHESHAQITAFESRLNRDWYWGEQAESETNHSIVRTIVGLDVTPNRTLYSATI